MCKDFNIVTFITNDMAHTPLTLMAALDDHAWKRVNGRVTVRRWKGGDVVHSTPYEFPAILLAHDLFINRVDRLNQLNVENIS